MFNIPGVKQTSEPLEIGVDLIGDNNIIEETNGEIYKIDIDKLPKSDTRNCCKINTKGRSIILLTKADIKNLLSQQIDLVEVVITDDNQLLMLNHHMYDPKLTFKEE